MVRQAHHERDKLTTNGYCDRIPEGGFSIVPPGEDYWEYWVEWLAENPNIRAPDGFGVSSNTVVPGGGFNAEDAEDTQSRYPVTWVFGFRLSHRV